jgi:hypothetical protein
LFTAGVHQVKVFSSLPNGQNDAVNGNDTLTVSVNVSCATTGIEESHESYYNVYPNPASEVITVECTLSAAQELNMQLVNSIGQVVEEINLGSQPAGNHSFKMDVSKRSPGIYTLLFSGDNKVTAVKAAVAR